MFPTTVWTTIRNAGLQDKQALEEFALRYRSPVLNFIRSRGFRDTEAQDVCQDVFVRLLSGNVLARADGDRGKFRSLLLAVTSHVIIDRFRRRKEPLRADSTATTPISIDEKDQDKEFDRGWVVHLAEQAMAQLRNDSPRYHKVLRDHLEGRKPDRNKLWIARRKLIGQIKSEIAHTCSSHEEFREELQYLSRFLRPKKKI